VFLPHITSAVFGTNKPFPLFLYFRIAALPFFCLTCNLIWQDGSTALRWPLYRPSSRIFLFFFVTSPDFMYFLSLCVSEQETRFPLRLICQYKYLAFRGITFEILIYSAFEHCSLESFTFWLNKYSPRVRKSHRLQQTKFEAAWYTCYWIVGMPCTCYRALFLPIGRTELRFHIMTFLFGIRV
jgi:hypothetical protein